MRFAIPIIGFFLTGTCLADELLPPPRELRFDRFGDRLPEGAIARLGTTRQRHPGATHLSFNADGSRFITWGPDTPICTWNTKSGERLQIRSLAHRTGKIQFVSEDGRLAGLLGPNELEIWNVEDDKLLHKLPFRDSQTFRATAISRDAKWVATADFTPREHRIRVWELATGKDRVVGVTESEVVCLLFSPDGKRLYSNCREGESAYAAWDLKDDKLIWQSQAVFKPTLLGISDDGRRLIVQNSFLSGDPNIGLIDTDTGKDAKFDWLIGCCGWNATFSPDRKWLAVKHDVSTVVHQLGERKQLAAIEAPIDALAFRRDGSALQVIEHECVVQAYDPSTGKALYPDARKFGHTAAIQRLIWSADGKALVSASDHDPFVHFWNTSTGESTKRITAPKWEASYWGFTRGERELLGGSGHVVVSLNTQNGDLKQADCSGLPNDSLLKAMRALPDGRRVRLAFIPTGKSFSIATLDVVDGKARDIHALDCSERSYGHIVFGHNHVAADDCLFHAVTGEPLPRLKDRDALSLHEHFAFSKDDRLLAAFGWNSSGERAWFPVGAKLFDRVSGQTVMSIDPETRSCFDFSPDGRRLAMAGHLGVAIWDISAGDDGYLFDETFSDDDQPFERRATALAFSPDGKKVAVGYANSTILIWEIPERAVPPAAKLTEAQLESLWSDLGGHDAKKAWRAIWQLQDRPEQAFLLLKDRLKPAKAPDEQAMKKLLRGLDDESFRQREATTKLLTDLGDAAKPSLELARKEVPTEDKKQRLEKLLANLDSRQPPRGDDLRGIRCLAVLESIKTDESHMLIERLAGGIESARLTREAKETLERLPITKLP